MWCPRPHNLIHKIDAFVQHYNRSSRPFVWTATANSIPQKVARLCPTLFAYFRDTAPVLHTASQRVIVLGSLCARHLQAPNADTRQLPARLVVVPAISRI